MSLCFLCWESVGRRGPSNFRGCPSVSSVGSLWVDGVPLTSEGVPLFTLLGVCESVSRRGPSNFRLKIGPHVHSYYISTRGKFYYRRGPNIVFFPECMAGGQSSLVASSTDCPLFRGSPSVL